MKPFTKVLILVLTASLVLIGCSQQATPPQTTDLQTAFASTLVAMQTQIAIQPTQPAAAPTTVQPTVMPTPAPTATLEPTPAPTATVAAAAVVTAVVPVTSATYGPSFRVGDVIDLNFPDGTYVNAGMTFTKIWQVTNVGTATWPLGTKIVSVDDNPFALTPTVLSQVVSNGQSVEIHVTLKAPEAVNNYQSKFMLETPDGKMFGIGPDYNQPFWVLLYVR